MKKRSICTGFILCIGIGLFTGCREKTVDYRVDEETESEGAHRNSIGGKRGIGQFAGDSEWWDEWTVVTEEENVVTLSVEAKISLPKAEQMYVVEVEKPEFDSDYKKKIAKQIFGNQEIYYNDLAHLPKKDLEKERKSCQERIRANSGNDDLIESLETELMEYEELLETAKDTYTPIETYDVDEYMGERDGVSCGLTFREVGAGFGVDSFSCEEKWVVLSPKDMEQFCPEELRGEEGVHYVGSYTEATAKNQCGISEEQAFELAQRFVDRMDLGYPIFSRSSALLWYGSQTTEEIEDGYAFYYDAGIDQVSFPQFGSQNQYLNYGNKKQGEKGQYFLDANLEIGVTDEGVVGMVARNPIEIIGISGETELLPLGEVEGIMKEQMTENFAAFRFNYGADRKVVFNKMELIYFRIRDRKNPGHYSYIPTWRLSKMLDDSYGLIENQVLINAIDGSVIDFYDEV